MRILAQSEQDGLLTKITTSKNINQSDAEFISLNKIYWLYQLPTSEVALVVEILPHGRQGPVHWNRNVFILMKFSSLDALEVVKMTTSSTASDENFIKKTFSFF